MLAFALPQNSLDGHASPEIAAAVDRDFARDRRLLAFVAESHRAADQRGHRRAERHADAADRRHD
jgi:hypothetical protein